MKTTEACQLRHEVLLVLGGGVGCGVCIVGGGGGSLEVLLLAGTALAELALL